MERNKIIRDFKFILALTLLIVSCRSVGYVSFPLKVKSVIKPDNIVTSTTIMPDAIISPSHQETVTSPVSTLIPAPTPTPKSQASDTQLTPPGQIAQASAGITILKPLKNATFNVGDKVDIQIEVTGNAITSVKISILRTTTIVYINNVTENLSNISDNWNTVGEPSDDYEIKIEGMNSNNEVIAVSQRIFHLSNSGGPDNPTELIPPDKIIGKIGS